MGGHISDDELIDTLCDSCEERLRAGEGVDLFNAVQTCDQRLHDRLVLELLELDIYYARQRGEALQRVDYLKRYPEFRRQIETLDFREGIDGPSSSPHPPQAGETLGRYELVERIGAGGSGEVWKAFDPIAARYVAVKFPLRINVSPIERRRFLREGRSAAQLSHPNIVKVLDVGRDGSYPYIVSELIDGLDLKVTIATRRFSATDAVELSVVLADAMHHAHSQGVIHRDLKPANVLLDAHGTAYVTDFGLAKWESGSVGLTQSGEIVGTLAYMAPEQARGRANEVDQRTDIYGLGAILFELLTGHPPFEGEFRDLIWSILYADAPSPRRRTKGVTRDLDTACRRALEKRPWHRYATALDFGDDLRRCLRGEPIHARPPSPLRRVWCMVRHRPATATSVVLVLLIATVAVFISRLYDNINTLKGYQLVRLTTEPAGARVAIVPIDPLSDGPNPDEARVVRPAGLTPLTVKLKPGAYFIEGGLFDDGKLLGLAEVTRVIPGPDDVSITLKQFRWTQGGKNQPIEPFPIRIVFTSDATAGMTLVRFDKAARVRRPELPRSLYVDNRQTLPADLFEDNNASPRPIVYDHASDLLESAGKRLPTATEYDELRNSLAASQRLRKSLDGLMDNYPEWTTTRFRNDRASGDSLRLIGEMLVLRGYAAAPPENYISTSTSASAQLVQERIDEKLTTAFRGVRSAEPRFVRDRE
jgi:hypothetical protein